MTARYAIYFAPAADSQLAKFGQTVLVRTALDAAPANLNHHSDAWMGLLSSPRHYGFHATLKAPFELKPGIHVEQLLTAVKSFTRTQPKLHLHRLGPKRLQRFFALAFLSQPDSIKQFAKSCVIEFEPFRASLNEADRKRRQPENLTKRQRDYLDSYGYPYVLDEFNFHMTLSNQLDPKLSPSLQAEYFQWLEQEFDKTVIQTPQLDQIAVYFQPDRATPFTQLDHFELTG